MSQPKPHTVHITSQVSILKKNLELPITNLVFNSQYAFVNLYVNQDMIGTLGYDAGLQIHYHKPEEKKIAWDKIYMQNKDVINTIIKEQEPLTHSVTIGLYKTLYVKDKDGNVIKKAYCSYRDDSWVIVMIEVVK